MEGIRFYGGFFWGLSNDPLQEEIKFRVVEIEDASKFNVYRYIYKNFKSLP